jgi:PilZ domain
MERRREPRLRTLKSARILLNHHHSVIDCTVRNLSPFGACLQLASTVGIPQRFDVLFDADHSVRQCRVVWHKERHLGVEFASGAVPLARSA